MKATHSHSTQAWCWLLASPTLLVAGVMVAAAPDEVNPNAVTLALEPGPYLDDLLALEALQWVFEDLGKYGLGYWHDTGNIHVRERMGLPCQGEWLERLGSRMLGVHLRDVAENELEKPPGAGEVDFRLIADYVPKDAARVVEVNPRHGRAEILQSIQFLTNQGF